MAIFVVENPESLITAETIHKAYGSVQVLKGVSLQIAATEVVSITGPSGAGKTTLLQILGTLDQPDSGRLVIRDQVIGHLKGRQLSAFRNQHIGFIFQFHHLLPEFDALENVAMPFFLAGGRKQDGFQRARELLAYMGLSHRLQHKPSALSGGEQQRVAVARALTNNPAVILADEPSGNLDTQTAEDLHNLFFQLRAELGQTFVIVTHNEALAAMADRKLRMVDGRFQPQQEAEVTSTSNTL